MWLPRAETIASQDLPNGVPADSLLDGQPTSANAERPSLTCIDSAPRHTPPATPVIRAVEPEAVPAARRSARSRLRHVVAFVLLAAGTILGWNSLPEQTLSATALATPTPVLETTPIAEIRVGQRVLAHNPIADDTHRNSPEPDSDFWRVVRLEMDKSDGDTVEIHLLRPIEWLQEHAAVAGETIDLDYAEFGAVGEARVLAILPCPEIELGEGEVVTGTFAHSSGDVLDVLIDGEPQPIGTTGNHRWWSEDRQNFVEARELRQGERLRTADGRVSQVASLTRRSTAERVFNLEVNREHVYHVGTSGVLVHNTYVAPTGQMHHVISTKISRALDDHQSLKNLFRKRDSRYVMQAIDTAAHRGYQTWHRQLDDKVVNWLNTHESASEQQFLNYLHRIYSRPEMRTRFPNGF